MKKFLQRSFMLKKVTSQRGSFRMLLSSKIERSHVLSNFIRFDSSTVREMEKNFYDLKLPPACRAISLQGQPYNLPTDKPEKSLIFALGPPKEAILVIEQRLHYQVIFNQMGFRIPI